MASLVMAEGLAGIREGYDWAWHIVSHCRSVMDS